MAAVVVPPELRRHTLSPNDGRPDLPFDLSRHRRPRRRYRAREGRSAAPAKLATDLTSELETAQKTLKCCSKELCQRIRNTCGQPGPDTCTLTTPLLSCAVSHPDSGPATSVETGGALRIASTFAEILLLEYANNFPPSEVGWGIKYEDMTSLFRIHTKVFDLEEGMSYAAKVQGYLLLKKILLALQGTSDNVPGTAPPAAKFVAYVGHDTNIINVAGMLGLSWQQPGYQPNQTPPAGALTFELRETAPGNQTLYVSYVAQALGDAQPSRRSPGARRWR